MSLEKYLSLTNFLLIKIFQVYRVFREAREKLELGNSEIYTCVRFMKTTLKNSTPNTLISPLFH